MTQIENGYNKRLINKYKDSVLEKKLELEFHNSVNFGKFESNLRLQKMCRTTGKKKNKGIPT